MAPSPPTGPTVVTAPGKVLVVGGYLVLDRKFPGLVLGTDSRFYTVIRSTRPSPNQPTNGAEKRIKVFSPQFNDGFWEYVVSRNEKTKLWDVHKSSTSQTANKFVELGLRYSLSVADAYSKTLESRLDQGLIITILGHNDFYSQRAELRRRNLPLTSESLRRLPPFSETHTTIPDVAKTGLGSSAAMITSLVAGILSHLGAVHFEQIASPSPAHQPTAAPAAAITVSSSTADSPPGSLRGDDGLTLTHNVAQFVHCLAQGKVGSGFDVSSAVWGSQTYRRFSPKVLEGVMAAHDKATLNRDQLVKALDPTAAKGDWDNEVVPFRLPPKVHLMLCDIHGGSSTPVLVKRVLHWRETKPVEAGALWEELDGLNRKVVDGWRELARAAEKDANAYKQAVGKLEGRRATEWSAVAALEPANAVLAAFASVHAVFLRIRHLIRRMSSLADVPIEPPEQTAFLDAVARVPGVVMCGVPGAGGFDAIFVLTIGTRSDVEMVWKNWVFGSTNSGDQGGVQNGQVGGSVCPLLAEEGVGGVRREPEEGRNGIHSLFF